MDVKITPEQVLNSSSQLKVSVSDDCGCPEEEWDMFGIHVTIHLEEDGGGHIFLDTGEWEDEKLVDCSDMKNLRIQAAQWISEIAKKDES